MAPVPRVDVPTSQRYGKYRVKLPISQRSPAFRLQLERRSASSRQSDCSRATRAPKYSVISKSETRQLQLPLHIRTCGKTGRPGPTITTGCVNPSRGRFLHPTRNHGITVRHAARFQTFPDSFTFTGGLKQFRVRYGDSMWSSYEWFRCMMPGGRQPVRLTVFAFSSHSGIFLASFGLGTGRTRKND
jgi:site-specific DNA-cytosine methylase